MVFVHCLCVRVDNARYNAKSLGSPFSEQNSHADFQVLRTVHESEFYVAFIPCSKQVLVHLHHLRCLTNHSTMDHSLVVCLDSGCMMQYNDFSFKIVNCRRCDIFINKNHAFSKIVAFQCFFFSHAFYVKTNSLSTLHTINRHSLVVD